MIFVPYLHHQHGEQFSPLLFAIYSVLHLILHTAIPCSCSINPGMTDQVSTFVRPKLDPDLYSCLEDNEIAFFKEQTGIADSIALKDHILAVQAEGFEVGRVYIIMNQDVLYSQSAGLCLDRWKHTLVFRNSPLLSRSTSISHIQMLNLCPRLHMSRHPSYNDLLSLGRQRDGAIFLDIGCCCGLTLISLRYIVSSAEI